MALFVSIQNFIAKHGLARFNSGQLAEKRAATWLKKQGLQILEKNYRCRFGEVDLIALDKDTLVFLEIRLRRNKDYGGAAASITSYKQKCLIRTAGYYLSCHDSFGIYVCRFDCLLLDSLKKRQQYEWIKDAFYADRQLGGC